MRSVSRSSSTSKASAFKHEKSSVSDVSSSDSYRLDLWTAGRAALQRLNTLESRIPEGIGSKLSRMKPTPAVSLKLYLSKRRLRIRNNRRLHCLKKYQEERPGDDLLGWRCSGESAAASN